MSLVFAKDHLESGKKYFEGNVCPREFPHSRKRELVLAGILRKVSDETPPDAAPIPAPAPPFLTARFVDDSDKGPAEDH